MMLEHCVLAQNAIANQEDLVKSGFSRFWKIRASLLAQLVKNPRAVQETQVQFLGGEDPLEVEMTTHPGVLAWEIPWTEELGRLQSTGSQVSDTT